MQLFEVDLVEFDDFVDKNPLIWLTIRISSLLKTSASCLGSHEAFFAHLRNPFGAGLLRKSGYVAGGGGGQFVP